MTSRRTSLTGLLSASIFILVVATGAQAQGAADSTAALLDEYRELLQSLQRVQAQNQQIQRQISNRTQALKKAAVNADNFRRSEAEIAPLLNDMLESLSEFVELDIPLAQAERRQRLDNLRAVVDATDISIAEKFRRLLEAFQIETEYGREMSLYSDWLEIDGTRRNVSILHIGRIVLAYQTADRSETGFFNTRTRQWEALPDQYRSIVAEGLRIAARQAAPVMLRLPVAAPVATP